VSERKSGGMQVHVHPCVQDFGEEGNVLKIEAKMDVMMVSY
jgi:hypothetical protein